MRFCPRCHSPRVGPENSPWWTCYYCGHLWQETACECSPIQTRYRSDDRTEPPCTAKYPYGYVQFCYTERE
jgi:ribosomal protein L37AE/L43A